MSNEEAIAILEREIVKETIKLSAMKSVLEEEGLGGDVLEMYLDRPMEGDDY